MATAPAAKKSRKTAPRSGTSTASSAKAGAKNDDATLAEWSERTQGDAAAQGWGVFTCIDMHTKKVFLEMQSVGSRFKTDNDARVFIADQAKKGDALAMRAVRAVFRSKVGEKGRTR